MAFIARGPETISQDQEVSKSNPLLGDTESKFESPAAAINKLIAKTNPQKIVALAIFSGASSQNGKTFTQEDILNLFRRAGQALPKNVTRDFKDAVKSGYIDEDSKGVYRLLSLTDSIIQQGFKRTKKTNTKKNSPRASKPSNSSLAPQPVREEFSNLPTKTALGGYPNFFKLTLRSDQILWVLAYAKSHGLDGLSRAEICDYSKKIGGRILQKNFTSSNTPNVKNNHIWSQGSAIHISEGGERYLKGVTQAKED
jgi:hypothetical protein